MTVEGPGRWLDEAKRRHRSGDADGALRGYRRCLESAPDQPEIRMLAAMAAAQSGRPEEAVEHARSAVSARDDAASRLTLGRALLHSGEAEEALESLRRAGGEPAMAADANFHLGQALNRLGRTEEAVESLEASVAIRPGHGPAWNELGVIRMAMGMTDGARVAFQRSLEARPGDAAVLSNLAAAYLRLGDDEGAERAVIAALEADPSSARALAVLARLERNRGRLAESLAAWERCVRLDSQSADAWAGLGSARQAAGDLRGAEEAYRRSLDIAPGHPDALAGLAEWNEWQGHYELGLDLLRGVPALASSPGVDLVAGRLLRRLGRFGEARSRLETAAVAVTGDAVLRRQFAFSLGDVCDELGDVAAAWDWYQEGNRLTPARFDSMEHRADLARLASLAPRQREGGAGAGIVFIVGMPRSGTTLVEQILASHPEVAAAGELPVLGRLVRDFGADCARTEDAGSLVGDRYLEEVAGFRAGGALMTDKMPLNYQYVDMIGAVLPGAMIVHCCRDPRDVALSCYFTDFIDPALGFTTRLDWLTDYILAYQDFMARPRQMSGRILRFSYEAIVGDPEGESRRLLQFLGLPWDASCLNFSSSDRVAATASHAQVRRKIYGTSVGRWRAYETWLSPLLERLEKV
jgi:tetratricopeptide (TPR) repeat protein